MTEPAIRAEGLHKKFGDVVALNGIDLSVARGSVLGLLGPNGAGKTTAVKILTTLLAPDKGTARVGGFDVVREAASVRRVIGLAGQYAAVDENLTGRENLALVGRLYHLSRSVVRQRSTELLERFDLMDAAHRQVKTYSGGMRRRLDLAASLVGEPQILFLDEPTTGLDPRSRIELWKVIEKLVGEGTTLLLTSQYLEEVDRLAHKIAVIDRGKIIAEGTSDELKEKVGGEVIEVRFGDTELTEPALAALDKIGEAKAKVVEDGVIHMPTRQGATILAEVVRRLDKSEVEISDLSLRRPTLDDVFLALTGHGAEDTAKPAAKSRRRR